MTSIYKYPIEVSDEVTVQMPRGAKILCVQVQHGVPCVWARVNCNAAHVARKLHWRDTGSNADGLGKYIGTIQRGVFVLHLFETKGTK